MHELQYAPLKGHPPKNLLHILNAKTPESILSYQAQSNIITTPATQNANLALPRIFGATLKTGQSTFGQLHVNKPFASAVVFTFP